MTLVDSKHIEQHLDEEKPEGAENESVEQVAFADRILLNKIDLSSEADLERVEKRLREINAFAPIQRCQRSEVSVDCVLDLGVSAITLSSNEAQSFKTPSAELIDTWSLFLFVSLPLSLSLSISLTLSLLLSRFLSLVSRFRLSTCSALSRWTRVSWTPMRSMSMTRP